MNFIRFKTSVTFTPHMRVRDHDDSFLKNHPVFLVVYRRHGTTTQTLTTDNDSLAPFTLDTATWNGTDISLEVSPGEAASQMREGPPPRGRARDFSLQFSLGM